MGKELLAIPFFTGKKTESEKFAGAIDTYTIEAMMHDGKSLQSGTSHYLGQNFAKASNIQFLNKNEELEFAYSSSWGISTRLIGALVMVHGDNRGLVLPPKVAPIQVVLIPIGKDNNEVFKKVKEINSSLYRSGVRTFVDDSLNSPGWKFNEWEMKGVPVRIELGAKDLEKNCVTIFRRDTLEKVQIEIDNVKEYVKNLINQIQTDMYNKAKDYRDNRIDFVNNVDELLSSVENKK